ncbi:hypothetical protein HRbin39_01640 [bacterium HR39]|nr:hypothetical protein HRbin39_01640 [bacterium HR39]
MDHHIHPPARIVGRQAGEQLEQRARHGVDAGIARAHQRHPAAPCRELQRLGTALQLGSEREGVEPAPLRPGAQQGEIAVVAHQVLRPGERLLGGAGETGGITGPQPHHVDPPAGKADSGRIERAGRPGHGAGGHGVAALFDHEPSFGSDGGERRRLRHTGRAHRLLHHPRGVGKPRRLRGQFRGGEEASRHVEMRGQGLHRRLVHLAIETRHAGHRLPSEAGFGQRFFHQPDQRIRRRAAARPDPEGQHLRMPHQPRGIGGAGFGGDLQDEPGGRIRGQGGAHLFRQQALRIDDPQALALGQPAQEGGGIGVGAGAEARGRNVEGRQAGSGGAVALHHLRTEPLRHLPGQGAGPVGSEQRQHVAVRTVHHQHRRVGPLVGEMRGEQAHHDAGGAEGDDRHAGTVEPGEGGSGIVEGEGVPTGEAGREVKLGLRPAGGQHTCGLRVAAGEGEEGDTAHAASRRAITSDM